MIQTRFDSAIPQDHFVFITRCARDDSAENGRTSERRSSVLFRKYQSLDRVINLFPGIYGIPVTSCELSGVYFIKSVAASFVKVSNRRATIPAYFTLPEYILEASRGKYRSRMNYRKVCANTA